MLVSLETRWLHAEKWLPLPAIVIASQVYLDTLNCEGMWCPPNESIEYVVEGRCYEASQGLIILADNACDGTLAHEFRHHWQYWRGFPPDTSAGIDPTLPRKEAIVQYFSNSRTEMDALLYEARKAPKHNSAVEWIEWIREARKHEPRTGIRIGADN
jgi:hypothetical protein